jgi:hypothetical protein
MDPVGAESIRTLGKETQQGWGCPFASQGEWPTSREHLRPTHLAILDGIGRLTGANTSEWRTCPKAALRLPWVAEAVRARRLAELGLLVPDDQSAAMIDALDLVGVGVADCAMRRIKQTRDELKERTEKRDG